MDNNKAIGHRLLALKSVKTTHVTAVCKAAARRWLAGISREGLLGIALIVVAFTSVFYLFTRTYVGTDSSPASGNGKGFRSVLVSGDLSLQQVAENWKYYRTMISVCHGSGRGSPSIAYAYLFYSFDRHSQNGKWPHKEFSRAVAAPDMYYEIDPVRDCKPGAINLHGLDVDEDLWLRTRALNYVFYRGKRPVCKKAGNNVQARTYMYMAESELAKLSKTMWSTGRVNAAISHARVSPDLNKIFGC